MNLPADINMHVNPPVTTATVVHEPAAESTVERPETELETLQRDNSEKDKLLFKFRQAIKELQLKNGELTLSNELISARRSWRWSVLATEGSVSMCLAYLALVADENFLARQTLVGSSSEASTLWRAI